MSEILPILETLDQLQRQVPYDGQLLPLEAIGREPDAIAVAQYSGDIHPSSWAMTGEAAGTWLKRRYSIRQNMGAVQAYGDYTDQRFGMLMEPCATDDEAILNTPFKFCAGTVELFVSSSALERVTDPEQIRRIGAIARRGVEADSQVSLRVVSTNKKPEEFRQLISALRDGIAIHTYSSQDKAVVLEYHDGRLEVTKRPESVNATEAIFEGIRQEALSVEASLEQIETARVRVESA